MVAAATATDDSFLELRERLKQDIRNKRMKQTQQQQNNSVLSIPLSATTTATASADYGSFFGPSLCSVAPRVIQECKLLLQNPNSEKSEKVRVPPSKPKTEVIKTTRDYSFLYSDETPAPVKSVSSQSKPAMESDEEQARVVSRNEKVKTKAHGLKNNQGPTQLTEQYSGPKSLAGYTTIGKLIPNARPAEKLGRITTAKARPNKRRLEECDNVDHEESSKLPLPNKRRLEECDNVDHEEISKLPLPNKRRLEECDNVDHEEISKLPLPNKRRLEECDNVDHEEISKLPLPNKRRLEECDNVDPEEISKFIRGLYGYNPSKYGKDDCDDRYMEANFHEIEKEERRSAKLGRKEDEEELLKTIEESKKEIIKKKKLNKQMLD